ncbi:MAG: formylmethanofuran dehydrogenase subunit A [Isosphaeraceae bacterium]
MSLGEPLEYDLRIRGGLVVDPANGIDEECRDLWISDGRMVSPPNDPDIACRRTIDARGYVVMPAGVDVHCHIAGSKVNGARLMRPEDHRDAVIARRPGFRSGTVGSTPTTFATGYLYTGLGYGTALDASIPALLARQAHHEFDDTPILDKAFLVLMGNNHLVLEKVRDRDAAGLRNVVAWLLGAAKGYGVKVVNPGGVERWKEGCGNVVSLDDVVESYGVTPRSIMESLATAIDELRLPHPMHLHGLNLGLPGNWRTTLETLQALDGHRLHLAHVQFHSYGDEEGKSPAFGSRVADLASHVNDHDGVTVDVGQVIFGDTTSMTADGAVGQFLAGVTGRKWLNLDVEAETGCGVVPITYSDRNAVHALQWAIGLEWFLSVDDPWKLALSTDHPNGGSFLAYPRIVAWLMSQARRAETLATLPASIAGRTPLSDLSREYTLAEIAIITRAAPARMMGLSHKGHLGPGADADITIYSPDDDRERMFGFPRYVIKSGEVVLDDGDLKMAPPGTTLYTAPEYDRGIEVSIRRRFDAEGTIRFENLTVDLEEIARPCTGPPVGKAGQSDAGGAP